jgi:hypothetical protein
MNTVIFLKNICGPHGWQMVKNKLTSILRLARRNNRVLKIKKCYSCLLPIVLILFIVY